MKSRTSSFNTVLRKSMLRFAPCWALYTIGLVLVLLLMSTDSPYWFASDLAEWIIIMVLTNLGYALLVAQLLFGDLFNSRMCNALHAMPLRRESWFSANVTAGLWFSFLPTLVTALVALPFLCNGYVENGWQIALYWLLGGNLSYIAFFGIAVLCVHLTGNRFAMAVVYGIINFAAVILYWLVDTLYTPMLYGTRTPSAPFFRLTPVVHMMDAEYLDVVRVSVSNYDYGTFSLTADWCRLAIWAGVGLVALVLALLLYRKRKLECAGDFMAFKAMEPVFLVIYTLIVGTCFQFIASDIIGTAGSIAYLFVGLAVGWFTGQMLLKRTIRVFKWKVIGGCLLTFALMGLSLALTSMDILGIESWVPEASEVKVAYISQDYWYSGRMPSGNGFIAITDPEDLEKVLYIHENSREPLEEREPTIVSTEDWYGYTAYAYVDYRFSFTLAYELENGRIVYRYYEAYADTEIGEILKPWFSSVPVVTGLQEDHLQQVVDTTHTVYLHGVEVTLTREQIQDLMDAIVADCHAGNMCQRVAFHEETCVDRNFHIEFSYTSTGRLNQWTSLSVYPCCENVYQWMDDNDMWPILEDLRETYSK